MANEVCPVRIDDNRSEQSEELSLEIQNEKLEVNIQNEEPEVKIQNEDEIVKIQNEEPEVKIRNEDQIVKIQNEEPEVKIQNEEQIVEIQNEEPEVKIRNEEQITKIQNEEPEVKIQNEELEANSPAQTDESDHNSLLEKQIQPSNKITVVLRPAGEAPILKNKKWLIEPSHTVGVVHSRVRKMLKLPSDISLLLYINQFCPALDTPISNLFECHGIGGVLEIYYSTGAAYG